jgi:hypothetical protein
MASPSFKNSGFETTVTLHPRAGVEDRLHLVVGAHGHGALDHHHGVALRCSASPSATAMTYERSAPPSGRGGVPTAMKHISASRSASARSVVKRSRETRRRCGARAPRGRAHRWGCARRAAPRTFSASVSTQVTSLPNSAKPVPATSPRTQYRRRRCAWGVASGSLPPSLAPSQAATGPSAAAPRRARGRPSGDGRRPGASGGGRRRRRGRSPRPCPAGRSRGPRPGSRGD